MNHGRRELLQAGAGLAGVAVCPAVFAQGDRAPDFPSRAIRLIVPFAPGGGTDIVARTIGQKLTEAWRQPVVVENRAGGNGTIGANAVAKAPPDGYTLSMLTSSHSVNVSLQGYKHPYDLLKDFAPISQVTRQPYVLVANPRLPRSVQELIALARSNPGKLTYGSSGVGGTSHLAGALFGSLADLEMTHVPYRGGEPAMTDVVAGQIDMLFSTLLQSHGLIQAGKLPALAGTTPPPSPPFPPVPPLPARGLPGSGANPPD